MASQRFPLLTPWQPLAAERAESFLRELHRELDRRHPLYGLWLQPVAHSGDQSQLQIPLTTTIFPAF